MIVQNVLLLQFQFPSSAVWRVTIVPILSATLSYNLWICLHSPPLSCHKWPAWDTSPSTPLSSVVAPSPLSLVSIVILLIQFKVDVPLYHSNMSLLLHLTRIFRKDFSEKVTVSPFLWLKLQSPFLNPITSTVSISFKQKQGDKHIFGSFYFSDPILEQYRR